ncbi:MAG TPA: potassium-transporting ATPase subunit KdpC [Ramlibacter sp.]|uniref:potassium-transporting ATPase subunit KdpC n=1 Tax=Ramlibacter sp. TaxID=1917967 RepID=UPI002CBCF56B|nr:potassium-transporting ATPase subunit KdpC [Ramlibacter sp.]HVZ43393.1 potassium-transporting ATPase subunit KdpC [Ramlibacter sp.]
MDTKESTLRPELAAYASREASRESIVRPALAVLAVLTVLVGVVYPLVVTGVSQAVFPHQANGSLVMKDGKAVGSEVIGQNFADPKHFWGRPSATGPQPYNGTASSGSNQGPLNPALIDAVKGRIEALRAADPDNKAKIPVDLVTASASGLDPHITPAAARYQVARVAKARGLSPEQVAALVERRVETPWFGFIGEPRVNVLGLNLDLDAMPAARQ